jgi:phosphohistidine phosphatase
LTNDIGPDEVLCSSGRRNRDTLDGIREALGRHPRVEVEEVLYACDAEDLVTRLGRLTDEVRSALIVAHIQASPT